MDNFVVSARKYRPSDFHSVVGQSHITSTLQNALRNNQLAQAFLFCGPRGVGKTTCARILAKTINCTNVTNETEACNECESCRSFNSNSSFNIVELDAASNNSVEDIRSLIEQVRIPPQNGKYKVYIIDEVHMLSSAAFNAFLKTLEEPPAYAKFILATTEKHKIMPTILSRCQIFDFHRISNDDIANHLEYIAQRENVAYEKEALHIIAQKADGGLRDALSMFDQLVSFTQGNLSYKNIIDNLNILDYDYYFQLTEQLLASDVTSCLMLFDHILKKGFEGSHFIGGLANHFRNLLVCKNPASASLLEVSGAVAQKYVAQSQKAPQLFLLRALEYSNSCALEYKESFNKRLCIELGLMKMAYIMNKLQPQAQSAQPIAQGNPQQPYPNPSVTQPMQQNTADAAMAEAKKKNDSLEETSETKDKQVESAPAKTDINIKIVSPFAINKAIDKTRILEQRNIEQIEQKKIDDFNLFKATIEKMAEEYETDFPNLAFSLKKAECIQLNDEFIVLEVTNKISEHELECNKQKIKAFVKEQTGMDDYFLQVRCKEMKQQVKIYTPEDTLEYFRKKSEVINDLLKTFDCDFKY